MSDLLPLNRVEERMVFDFLETFMTNPFRWIILEEFEDEVLSIRGELMRDCEFIFKDGPF